MGNPIEGKRHFRPDRHSKAAYQAKAAEGGVRRLVRKLSETSVNLHGQKPDLRAHKHIALEAQALEDIADTGGSDSEDLDEVVDIQSLVNEDDEPKAPARLERRGVLPPSADLLSDGPTAEEVEREGMEAFEYVETAADLRS